MKRPPLMMLCWGQDNLWFAKVLKVGMAGGKWKPAGEEDRREIQGPSARDAVLRALSRFGKAPRTCRRCGAVWECRRTRSIRICPRCQTQRGVRVVPDIPATDDGRLYWSEVGDPGKIKAKP